MVIPEGLSEAFWRYEKALGTDDLEAMDELFAAEPDTLRGDRDGLLVGHELISGFRQIRGGAPARRILATHVQTVDGDTALVVAVTAPQRGGRGQQTQLWRRRAGRWQVTAAHVSLPPTTFDPRVWRVVGDPLIPASSPGPLTGSTLAVEDVIAVAGQRLGAGVPAYLDEQDAQVEHAEVVGRLIGTGAAVAGIARTGQFGHAVHGVNPHYGTPPNAINAGAVPGSGAGAVATAVALGAATIGVANDTAGSAVAAASRQGLWAIRLSAVPALAGGVVPLGGKLDARCLVARQREPLLTATTELAGGGAADCGAPIDLDEVVGSLPDLDEVATAFQIAHAAQAWRLHGDWIAAHPGALAGSSAAWMQAAADLAAEAIADAWATLQTAAEQLDRALGSHVLRLPGAAEPTPLRWATAAERDADLHAGYRLSWFAAASGRPSVTIPGSGPAPVGVSYLGPIGSEATLLERAAGWHGDGSAAGVAG